MADRITERDLQGVAGVIAREFPGRPVQIHSESGLWIADIMAGEAEPERWRIHHRLATCTTKRELYDWLHAFVAGVQYREFYA